MMEKKRLTRAPILVEICVPSFTVIVFMLFLLQRRYEPPTCIDRNFNR
jgi:hypothetical protein